MDTQPTSPSARYQAALARGELQPDAAQASVVHILDDLYHALKQRPRVAPWYNRLRRRAAPPPQGVYLWGGVGRGKTVLMDLFYTSLPFPEKRRLHFYRFMQRIHQERLRHAGSTDPLRQIAAQWAREIRVLCFDEFWVKDIADAMILAQLLQGLFERGVVMVATANTPPEDLYAGGLQRGHFLPAIALIQQHCQVLAMDAGKDYRLAVLQRAAVFYWPLGTTAEQSLEQRFRDLAGAEGESNPVIIVNHRKLPALRRHQDVIWFDFAVLCASPRSQEDYIELARAYRAVLISNIPALDATTDDQTRRLLSLVDEFYDHGVKLLFSSAVPPDALYCGQRLAFEFQRTISRLQEMQSERYLAQPHQP